MIQKLCVKLMIFLLILVFCLPMIVDTIDTYNDQLSSMAYDLGVDLSVKRLLGDPLGAVEDIISNTFDADRILESIVEY